MAESMSRRRADDTSAALNARDIARELGLDPRDAEQITQKLRGELVGKGLKGFKRGGKVKKTGVAKVHKGERVLTPKQAKTYAKAAPRRAAVSRRVAPRAGKRR